MGLPASDIDMPDPLESSEDHRVGNSEDLLSQLAGDAVNRMMAENAVDPPPSRLNPVQELTSQLDTFFEELRQRQAETAAAVDAIPDANPIEINDAERAALDAGGEWEASEPPPPRELFPSYESKRPTPWLLRPLAGGGRLVETLSPAARAVISVTSILSFLAACAALGYVLILRHG